MYSKPENQRKKIWGWVQGEKRKNDISQMRLRSVFKMRTSILNTATIEQMGYIIFSFFVYTKSTD